MDRLLKTNAGQLFHKIRNNRGFSVAQLSSGILSPSTINKFEAGTIQLSFFNLAPLLQKMDYSLDDFYNQVQTSSASASYRKFLDGFESIYQENDLPTLKKASQELCAVYEKDQNFQSLIQAATAISLTKSVDQSYETNPLITQRITEYLLKVNYWGKLEVAIFNNCSFLLTSQMVKTITKELIYSQSVSALALINVADLMYQRQEYQLAKEIVKQVENLRLNQNDLVTRFKFLFMKNLLTLDASTARVRNQQLIDGSLRSLGSNSLASTFEVYMTKHSFPNT
ncbi:MAG: helix-turn-helix domain-containing protein [Oenococcus sp.]|uniref:helix-turn-helix domain-containing protein n=1 Tax=Oenococcus TaxID=46254 RepID=UPI0021E81C57|nr:Rgg/GadR/MutR family transcriptional regulator [Oenococcus kitaharae]MCV3296888.1 Rgg/GadR/MutR family transcriptional regulator [Oenococcus kitaharae]